MDLKMLILYEWLWDYKYSDESYKSIHDVEFELFQIEEEGTYIPLSDYSYTSKHCNHRYIDSHDPKF